MSISADTSTPPPCRRSLRSAPPCLGGRTPVRRRVPTLGQPSAPRGPAGFTLIEIMVTLALVGLTLLPLLELRQRASNMAFRSGNMMRAMTYAQQLLAEHFTEVETLKERAGVIEADPVYRYEISLENFDLSTGRTEEEDEAQSAASGTSAFSETSAFVPADAGTAPELDGNDAYKVRRVKVVIYFPSLEGETEEKLMLEGYVPRAIDPEEDALLPGPGS